MTIDLVTEAPNGSYQLVLVEQGPWQTADLLAHLKRLQTRLHDVVDVAVDGLLLDRFPKMRGQRVTIRLDCYGVVREETERLLHSFAEHIAASGEVQDAIRAKGFVSGLSFSYSWATLC